MLGTLLKYDFRALNKVMLPLQLGVLIAGILGTILCNVGVRSMNNYSYNYYSSTSAMQSMTETFVESMSILGAIFLFSLVFVSGVITLFFVARNVYKNFYTSEGYLTFTLPVTIDQHLWSKTISGLVWLIINAIIIGISTVMLLIFGTSTEGLVSADAINVFGALFKELFAPLGVVFIIELVFLGLLSYLMGIFQVIFSIVIGGAAARTHKILAAIGFYLLSGMVISFASSLFSFFSYMLTYMIDGTNSYGSYSWFTELQPILIVSFLIYLGLSVAFYFISRTSLKRNLNLD